MGWKQRLSLLQPASGRPLLLPSIYFSTGSCHVQVGSHCLPVWFRDCASLFPCVGERTGDKEWALRAKRHKLGSRSFSGFHEAFQQGSRPLSCPSPLPESGCALGFLPWLPTPPPCPPDGCPLPFPSSLSGFKGRCCPHCSPDAFLPRCLSTSLPPSPHSAPGGLLCGWSVPV